MARIINGKRYTSFMKFRKKSDAVGTAKRYRSRGGLARVVKGKGKLPYVVFTNRG